MTYPNSRAATLERPLSVASGWLVLAITIALLLGGVATFVVTAIHGPEMGAPSLAGHLATAIVAEVLAAFLMAGFFTLQPNEARVLILFGHYRGTVRDSGFHWANPFYARSRGTAPSGPGAPAESARPRFGNLPIGRIAAALQASGYALPTKISLRANNFTTETLKVNDKRGNPVEIGAVVVWRVGNTAQAVFDVEDYTGYVKVQSETAIRSIASRYAYDHGEEHEVTLRGGADEVAAALREELQARLSRAGIVVEDTRLSHLAYAPEIAPAMLRRQQAEAVVAARRIIVQNAVGMVRMALQELHENDVVQLDEERKAAMVSNLMVVLCGSSEATPVINTGTLYS
jgi:regulator of protease activity HflC (stomatin/prohibitin superfamily)